MSKTTLVLHTDEIRAKAKRWIDGVPKDSRVTFQPPRRTNPQNAKWFAMLTEISQQKRHHGLKLSPGGLAAFDAGRMASRNKDCSESRWRRRCEPGRFI